MNIKEKEKSTWEIREVQRNRKLADRARGKRESTSNIDATRGRYFSAYTNSPLHIRFIACNAQKSWFSRSSKVGPHGMTIGDMVATCVVGYD